MDNDRRTAEGRTFGNAWLYATLIKVLKAVNLKVMYAFSAVCVVPFTLVFSRGARITFRYYHALRNYRWPEALWMTYRNHCLFSQTVIDKFAMYAGKTFRFEYDGLDTYEKLMARPGPLLQLSAHIGCAEILGYTLHRRKPYNVLVDSAENTSMMDYRRDAFHHTDINMIPAGAGSTTAGLIADALQRGEIIGVFADRCMNSAKVITSEINGHTIRLAKGPFTMAVTSGLEVVMVSAMKTRDGHYKAFFKSLYYDRTLPAKEQRRQLADAYTAEIERLLKIYPEQWFNYFGDYQ